jgi:hypothetical protein
VAKAMTRQTAKHRGRFNALLLMHRRIVAEVGSSPSFGRRDMQQNGVTASPGLAPSLGSEWRMRPGARARRDMTHDVCSIGSPSIS